MGRCGLLTACQENGQDYTCFPEHHVTWSCSQIGPGTIGSMIMGAYMPLNTLSGLQALVGGFTYPTLPHAAYFSQKTVSGRKLTCLNFPSAKRSRATVCVTSQGIIGYYSSQVRASSVGPIGTTSLVSLSFHVPKPRTTERHLAIVSGGAEPRSDGPELPSGGLMNLRGDRGGVWDQAP